MARALLERSFTSNASMDRFLQQWAVHRDRCYELAEAAPTPEIRARLLSIARLYEREIELAVASKWRISASMEVIARVSDILARKNGSRTLP